MLKANKKPSALTIQSLPLRICRSWTSWTPSAFSRSRIWMWISVSGRFFSLPSGMAHPEGQIPRQRTKRGQRTEWDTLLACHPVNNLSGLRPATCAVSTVRPVCCSSLCTAAEWIFTGWCCGVAQSRLSEQRMYYFLRSFWLWYLGVRMRRSRPISGAIRGKRRWNQTQHKNKYMSRLFNTSSTKLSLSATRIFYLYALGVSSEMLKKVAWSQKEDSDFFF